MKKPLVELKEEMRTVARGEPPPILDAITDVVLAYRPKPKSAGSKKRAQKAKQNDKNAAKSQK